MDQFGPRVFDNTVTTKLVAQLVAKPLNKTARAQLRLASGPAQHYAALGLVQMLAQMGVALEPRTVAVAHGVAAELLRTNRYFGNRADGAYSRAALEAFELYLRRLQQVGEAAAAAAARAATT